MNDPGSDTGPFWRPSLKSWIWGVKRSNINKDGQVGLAACGFPLGPVSPAGHGATCVDWNWLQQWVWVEEKRLFVWQTWKPKPHSWSLGLECRASWARSSAQVRLGAAVLFTFVTGTESAKHTYSLNGSPCSLQLQQDLNFCEGQPLQRTILKNLLVSTVQLGVQ